MNADLDFGVRHNGSSLISMGLRIPMPDAATDFPEEIEAAFFGEVSKIANQIRNSVFVAGAATSLKGGDRVGGPRDMVGLMRHVHPPVRAKVHVTAADVRDQGRRFVPCIVIAPVRSMLTWPALASRQAGPWARKTSETSRAGRATCSEHYAGAPCSAGFLAGISARIMRWRGGLAVLSVMAVAPVSQEVTNPVILRQDELFRHRQIICASRARGGTCTARAV
jgi:hypothetical protein